MFFSPLLQMVVQTGTFQRQLKMWTAPIATPIGPGIGVDQEKFGKGTQIHAHHLSVGEL